MWVNLITEGIHAEIIIDSVTMGKFCNQYNNMILLQIKFLDMYTAHTNPKIYICKYLSLCAVFSEPAQIMMIRCMHIIKLNINFVPWSHGCTAVYQQHLPYTQRNMHSQIKNISIHKHIDNSTSMIHNNCSANWIYMW